MLCYRDNDRGDGKGPIPVKQQFSSKVFEMKHGSLFFLDPRDEQTKLRKHFDPVRLTYLKHGHAMDKVWLQMVPNGSEWYETVSLVSNFT